MKFMQASLLLVALLLVGMSTSQSTTFVHTFTGGLPFCTQCGLLGEYACSPDANGMTLGNWNSGIINFRDPIPQGNYATGMTVTLIGSYACNVANKLSMFGISVNGFTHAVRESTKGGQCKCDTCDGNEALSFTLRNGIPQYKYNGATNTLQITPYVDSVCLNKVNVTIFYSPTVVSPPTPLPEYYLAPTIPTGYDRVGCSVCNPGRNQWCSASNNNTFSLEFTDPLPAGFNYVVSIELYLSLNMVERAYTYSSTLAAKIQDEVIATKTIIDSGFRNKCGCMADYQFNSATYQRGWPGYVQHGKNYISLVVGKYSQTYGNICVGRLGIKLIYYAASDDEVKEIYLDDVKTI